MEEKVKNMNNKIGFIGSGKMANAIIKGIIDSKHYCADNIFVSDLNQETLDKIQKEFGLNTTTDNKNVIKNANVIVMAVKPFILKEVLEAIKNEITKDHLIISIAAGISIKDIQTIIPNTPVIRVMPNTPALVNEGMSAICKGDYTKENHSKLAVEIFKSVGKVIESEEKFIDIITAISGSGPAFYYYIIDEIAKAGEKLGLDYETCLRLSAQTAYGSAKMIMETQTSPEQLITNVTTPGGCTAVGNDLLKNSDISKVLYDTIEGTMKKAKSLGEK